MRSWFAAIRWRYERHPVTAVVLGLYLLVTVVLFVVYVFTPLPRWAYFAGLWVAALAGTLSSTFFYDKLLRDQNPLLPCRRCGTKPAVAHLQVHTEEGTQTFRVVGLDQQPDLCPECYEREGMRELVKNKKRAIRARFSAAEAVRRFGRKR